jgi:hypothetical protein
VYSDQCQKKTSQKIADLVFLANFFFQKKKQSPRFLQYRHVGIAKIVGLRKKKLKKMWNGKTRNDFAIPACRYCKIADLEKKKGEVKNAKKIAVPLTIQWGTSTRPEGR